MEPAALVMKANYSVESSRAKSDLIRPTFRNSNVERDTNDKRLPPLKCRIKFDLYKCEDES